MSLAKAEVHTRFRFSKERIAALPIPKGGPATYYDTDVKQLGLRLQPSGRGVFFVLKKVSGRTFRRTLGDRDHLQLEAARKHAHGLLANVADWLAGDRQDMNPMQRPIDDGRLTFALAFEAYLKSPRKRVTNRKKADKRARYWLDKYLQPIKNREVKELTPTFLAALHGKLTEDYGPIAANRCLELIRAVFNHLIAKELWSANNPTKGATKNPEESRARILEPDELQPFIDALQSEENRDAAEFCALLFACGPRKSNLYSCEWPEISFSMKTWTIPAEKSKNGKVMTLPLKQEAVELFRRRRERQPKDARWVFPSKAGAKAGHVRDYKRQFDRIKKAAGLEDFHMHDVRRTFVALMVASGKASMPVISAAAGHSSLASMGPYARFANQAVAKALDAGTEEMNKQIAEAEQVSEAEKERKLLSA
jgi:integrase